MRHGLAVDKAYACDAREIRFDGNAKLRCQVGVGKDGLDS